MANKKTILIVDDLTLFREGLKAIISRNPAYEVVGETGRGRQRRPDGPLAPGVTFEDVEMAVGELCTVVKGTYGGDKGGFIGRTSVQVFRIRLGQGLPLGIQNRR